MKHRIVFLSAWAALTLLQLMVVTLFDAHFRSLAFGQLIGTMVVQHLGLGFLGDQVLLIIPIFSGIYIFLCTWAMDRAALPNWLFAILAVAMVLGAGLSWSTYVGHYEGWKNSFEMATEREVLGEVDDSRGAFNMDVLYPMTIAGALWGVYMTAFGGLLYALVVFLMRRKTPGETPKHSEDLDNTPSDPREPSEKSGAPPP